MRRRWMLPVILLTVFGFSGPVGASLSVIGTASYGGSDYNLIYETGNNGRNLVWLDYSHPSPRVWGEQVSWAGGLNDLLIYTLNPGVTVAWKGDWRLPMTTDAYYVWGYDGQANTSGFNITSCEMGHLYQVSLGNLGRYDVNGDPVDNSGLLNTGPFVNLDDFSYWSATEYAGETPAARVWRYTFEVGALELVYKVETWPLAMAVREGDVAAAPVSPAVLLLGSGLVGLLALKRRSETA